MATNAWPTKRIPIPRLCLDTKNPRFGQGTSESTQQGIIQNLFDHYKALDLVKSIAVKGYYPDEPLLAIEERNKFVVVEGNRRLAALKVLREPTLLEGSKRKVVERLSRQIEDANDIARVPVVIASNRRATDQRIAGKHIDTPVLRWKAEDRARFIFAKLDENYTIEQLCNQFGFSLEEIQQARRILAITDMARSLDLPEDVRVKLDKLQAKLFTTLKRVLDSSAGQEYLMVEPDPDHGYRGKTTKAQFLRGFTKLVTDVALGNESSRTLNKTEDIQKYFEKWQPQDLPLKKRGSFMPEDIIQNQPMASPGIKKKATPKKGKPLDQKVLPRNFKVQLGDDRLRRIQKELTKLKRSEFPNTGAVMLRVFFELAVSDYLDRTHKLPKIVKKLKGKGQKLPFGVPTLRYLVDEIKQIAKNKLNRSDALKVEKAIRYDRSAPFTISELHGFVHQFDNPTENDLFQFWNRTEPLFRLMLEEDEGNPTE